jgi:hypothetical protein
MAFRRAGGPATGRSAGAGAGGRDLGGVVFDPCLDALAYRCSAGCPRGRTCCNGLAVEVTRREVRAIDGILDEVARLVPDLRDGDEYENAFVDDPPDLLVDPRPDGSCPFLYRTRTRSLCSIHTIALETGRALPSVKPASCRHWPLLLEPHGRGVRLTVQPAARGIGCVAPRRELPGHPSVREAFRDEIEEILRGRVVREPRRARPAEPSVAPPRRAGSAASASHPSAGSAAATRVAAAATATGGAKRRRAKR